MNIIRECATPELDYCFDGDCFTEKSGDYCNTLFILSNEYGRVYGLNYEEYKRVKEDAENLVLDFDYVDREYSFKQALEENGLKYSPNLCHKWKEWYEEARQCIGYKDIAAYLTLKTGKNWATMKVNGYCQGDYCTVIYCTEKYENPQVEGEIYLGCAKEFSVQIGDDEEVFGYIVADCQVTCDEDYKGIVCDYAGINPLETELQMIARTYTTTHYEYRTV